MLAFILRSLNFHDITYNTMSEMNENPSIKRAVEIRSSFLRGQDIIAGEEDMSEADGYSAAAWARVALVNLRGNPKIDYDPTDNKFYIQRAQGYFAASEQVQRPSSQIPNSVRRILGH